jgi:hypothetical protein
MPLDIPEHHHPTSHRVHCHLVPDFDTGVTIIQTLVRPDLKSPATEHGHRTSIS